MNKALINETKVQIISCIEEEKAVPLPIQAAAVALTPHLRF